MPVEITLEHAHRQASLLQQSSPRCRHPHPDAKSKFDPWIENKSPDMAANSLLALCIRVNKMLQSQISAVFDRFKQQGGFTENMTQERLEARRQQAASTNAPVCPECGKPMFKRMQKKGQQQGREFWGCSDYPRCDGTLPISATNRH